MPAINEVQSNEVETLRRANAELTEKARTRKAKITELESSVTELQGKLTSTETALHEATVGTPLRQLAATISAVPEIWQTEFSKHFKLQMRDGTLAVFNLKDEPVLDGTHPVEFTPASIAKMVTDETNEDLSVFRHITAGCLASGGGAHGDKASGFPTINAKKTEPSDNGASKFGLR